MNNPFSSYSTEIYIGEIRSGKTLSMVADTYINIKENEKNNYGYTLYSNFWLNPKYFGEYELIDKKELITLYENKAEFKKCIFLIDELQLFCDARNHATKSNKAIAYLIGQLGKRGNIFRGTTHLTELVDIRIRMYAEKRIFCTKGLIVNRRFRKIQNNNALLSDEETNLLYIQNESVIRKMSKYNFDFTTEYINYVKAKDYFDLYDTNELIVIENLREKENNDKADII